MLTAPIPEEPLLLYVAATHMVINAVLVTERDHEGSKVTGPDREVGPDLAGDPASLVGNPNRLTCSKLAEDPGQACEGASESGHVASRPRVQRLV